MDALSFGKQDKGKQGAVILEEDLIRRYKEGASCSAKGTHSSGGAGIQVHGVNPVPGAFLFPWESAGRCSLWFSLITGSAWARTVPSTKFHFNHQWLVAVRGCSPAFDCRIWAFAGRSSSESLLLESVISQSFKHARTWLAINSSRQTGAYKTFMETSDQTDPLIGLSPRELIRRNNRSERKWFLLHQNRIVLLQICSLAGLCDPFSGSYLVCNQEGSRYCTLKCIFDEVMKRECESLFLLLSSE